MLRWICPSCAQGVNLGERPRKNDARRYCLPCSHRTGSLVERICPVLERRREKAVERAKEQALKKRAKEKAKYIASGVDVLELAQQVWRTAQRLEPILTQFELPLLVLHRSRKAVFSSGHTYPLRKIHITAGKSTDDLKYVVVHEIAHSLAAARGGRHFHGDIFKAALAELLDETGIRNPRLTKASIQSILDEASQKNPKVEV